MITFDEIVNRYNEYIKRQAMGRLKSLPHHYMDWEDIHNFVLHKLWKMYQGSIQDKDASALKIKRLIHKTVQGAICDKTERIGITRPVKYIEKLTGKEVLVDLFYPDKFKGDSENRSYWDTISVLKNHKEEFGVDKEKMVHLIKGKLPKNLHPLFNDMVRASEGRKKKSYKVLGDKYGITRQYIHLKVKAIRSIAERVLFDA